MIKVFLDANVLYSNTARSLFIWLHINTVLDLYWSMEVWEEAFTAYARNHDAATADRFRTSMMRNAIANYPSRMVPVPAHKPIGLSDPDDEHVIAAAIECKADYLVTSDEALISLNLKKYDLSVARPSALLIDLAKANQLAVVQSVRDHVSNLSRSRPSIESYLLSLRRAGLEEFADWLEQRQGAKRLFAEVWQS